MREEVGKSKVASPTRVAHRANLPYDRFKKTVDQLVKLDLVNRNREGLELTRKGAEVLEEMRRANGFLRNMGLLT